MKDEGGHTVTGRRNIVGVFATFDADLYRRRKNNDGIGANFAELQAMPPVATEEVKDQLKKMQRRKACDPNVVVAELLKESGEVLCGAIAEVFTDVMLPESEVPAYWKETRLKVIHKKGDQQNPENYRPIAVLPILYKLFSRILCSRVTGFLLTAQSVDQAGFRPGFSCDDHLFAITLVAEKMNEYKCPLWIVAVDFKKAFDTIEHFSLWEALNEQRVPEQYIRTLQKLHANQK